MKKLIIGLVLVALLATAVSCGAPETGDKAPLGPPYTMDVEMVPPVAVSESLSIFPFGGGGGEPAEVVVPTTVPEERMIVRTADMTLIVADIAQTIEDTAQLAEGFNGYVVSSRMSGDEDKLRGWITIRVPDDKFDEAMAEIKEMAVRVDSESTYSEDVTKQYVDLASRLRNAEATEQQYLALLEKAEEVDDILNIYRSLSTVRQEIEYIKGEMEYLEQVSSTSLISVYLRAEASDKPLVSAGWNALEILKSAVRGIVVFGQVLATIAIWLLIFIPVWGTALAIVLWRLHKKRNA